MEPGQETQAADKPEVPEAKAPEVSAPAAPAAAAPVAADAQPAGNGADKNNKTLAAAKAGSEGEKKPAAAPVKPATADVAKPDATASGAKPEMDANNAMNNMIAIFIAPLIAAFTGKTNEEVMAMFEKKPAETKPAETKPVVAGADGGKKPADTKPSETKPAVAGADKPAAPVADAKPAETAPVVANAGADKPATVEGVANDATSSALAATGADPIVIPYRPAENAAVQGNQDFIAELADAGLLTKQPEANLGPVMAAPQNNRDLPGLGG